MSLKVMGILITSPPRNEVFLSYKLFRVFLHFRGRKNFLSRIYILFSVVLVYTSKTKKRVSNRMAIKTKYNTLNHKNTLRHICSLNTFLASYQKTDNNFKTDEISPITTVTHTKPVALKTYTTPSTTL